MERQACDRCHGYKVRCTRATDGGPCLRCQRAGADCVYGSSSPRCSTQQHGSRNAPKHKRFRSRPRSQTQPTSQPSSVSHVDPTPWLNTGLLTPGEMDLMSRPGYELAGSIISQQIPLAGSNPVGSQYGLSSHPSVLGSDRFSSLVDPEGNDPLHFQPFPGPQSCPVNWDNYYPAEHPPLGHSINLQETDSMPRARAPCGIATGDPIDNIEECMRRLFQLHLNLYRSCTPTNTITASQMVQFSQTLLVIIHSFYINCPAHPDTKPDSDNSSTPPASRRPTAQPLESATAVPLISCYNQLLLLYTRFIGTLQESTSLHCSSPVGSSLLPPSTSDLEYMLKDQLALHLLSRVGQSLRTYIALCLKRGSNPLAGLRVDSRDQYGFTQLTEPLEMLLSTLNEQEMQLNHALEDLSKATLQGGSGASRATL
ncbi:hypothetical protein BDW59DRAFT_164954 [Aspergillus cavernicola]|uniref:Zn(2)-C6 fungal-type domain-containing protein n=1 Tax=Aspergillus cavernicola TaxID=176166 RepID=A0ABR4HW74_9EURO